MTYRKREVHTHWESVASVRTLVTGRRHTALVHYCTPLRVLHGSWRHSVYHGLSSSAYDRAWNGSRFWVGLAAVLSGLRHAVINHFVCLAIHV